MAKSTPQKFLDEKFLAKLTSKENKTSSNPGESSFRVFYYGGGAGSVPFLWESQPGTPKHAFQDNTPPALSPPPPYKSSPKPISLTKKGSKNSKIFNSIFSSKKMSGSTSSSSSSSFSSSYSLPSSPLFTVRKSYKAHSSSSVRFTFEEDESGEGPPTSTLCFRPGNGSSLKLKRSSRSNFYYYPIKSFKKVVLAIMGNGRGNN